MKTTNTELIKTDREQELEEKVSELESEIRDLEYDLFRARSTIEDLEWGAEKDSDNLSGLEDKADFLDDEALPIIETCILKLEEFYKFPISLSEKISNPSNEELGEFVSKIKGILVRHKRL